MEMSEVKKEIKDYVRDHYKYYGWYPYDVEVGNVVYSYEEYRVEMEYPKDSDHCIQDYQPDCYYYWDSPLEEIYYWRDSFPHVDCMCEICFDIANFSKKIIWSDH